MRVVVEMRFHVSLMVLAGTAALGTLLFLADEAEAAHHSRGGTLQWEHHGDGEVEFQGTMAWRMRAWGAPAVGDVLFYTWQLNVDAASGTTVPFKQRVVHVEPADDWFVAEFIDPGTETPGITHTYANPLGTYHPYVRPPSGFGDRIGVDPMTEHINNPLAMFTMSTVVDLASADSSPFLTPSLPTGYTVPCEWGTVCWIPIPAHHLEDKSMRYRLATPMEAEGIPPATPGAYLHVGDGGSGAPNSATVHPNGTISWDTSGTRLFVGRHALYSMQVTTTTAGTSVRVPYEFMIHVLPPAPVADFTCVASTDPYLRVAFTDLSTTPAGTLTSWNWDLGDSTTATTPDVVHDYDTAGTFSVTLAVENDFGRIGTVTKPCTPYLNLPPVLDPVADVTVFEGHEIRFQVTGSDPDGDDTMLTWQRGQLPKAAAFQPIQGVFVWTPISGTAGTYPDVTFRITEILPPDHPPSRSDSETITIRVLEPPEHPGPSQNDADGDGAPDRHDECPADAECGGSGEVGGANGDGPDGGGAAAGAEKKNEETVCQEDAPEPRNVAAGLVDAAVEVTWDLHDPCVLVDHFLVWQGEGDELVARVPSNGSGSYLATQEEPSLPQTYYVLAMLEGEPDRFDADRAVASDVATWASCDACASEHDEPPAAGDASEDATDGDQDTDEDGPHQVGHDVPAWPLVLPAVVVGALAARRR